MKLFFIFFFKIILCCSLFNGANLIAQEFGDFQISEIKLESEPTYLLANENPPSLQLFDNDKTEASVVTDFKKKSSPNLGLKSLLLNSNDQPEEETTIRRNRSRRETYIPFRIGVTPTAFNLPSGQLLFSSSAGYLREFAFSIKYFRMSLGFSGVQSQIRVHTGIPIKKYLHLGLSLEASSNNNQDDTPSYAFAPILTIGTPDYFINLVYKSESPMFIPRNDVFDNILFAYASYWSFGGGVRVVDNLKFLTESALIEDENRQKHYRVFLGLTLNLGIQTVGAGMSIYDTQELENDPFGQTDFRGALPSFQYIIRFR